MVAFFAVRIMLIIGVAIAVQDGDRRAKVMEDHHAKGRLGPIPDQKAVPVHLVNFTEYKAKCVGMRFNEGPIQPPLGVHQRLTICGSWSPYFIMYEISYENSGIDDAYHDQFVTLWINFWFIETVRESYRIDEKSRYSAAERTLMVLARA
ncbi:hypothetical protein FOZ60_011984 [Perkinsus olseni]|uniref:Uncharacterized protein n=1 Tax=Perkinsus olseni TaxID=32597 RepID=A0A7J6NC94_PEROL|nr:hypothetical protein FOZ60_011984 [Perkinsus olseni]